ncbi:MAG: DeoR/GlpR family DNA-binding transcription regulator [Actinomycetota bacterium]
MLSAERKLEIAKIINKNGRIKTSELSSIFNVSEMTVLRDLASLEKDGVLKRVYGGALAFNDSSNEISSVFRDRIHAREKDEIALKAVKLVNEGDSLFLDGSTTSLALARKLPVKKNISVVTNGLEAVNELKGSEDIKVISTGGELNTVTMGFFGLAAENFLREVNVDTCFISAAGISTASGITEQNPRNISLKRVIIGHSCRVVLLIDSSKFGKVTLNRVCHWRDINTIITDKEPDKSYLDFFKEKDIGAVY